MTLYQAPKKSDVEVKENQKIMLSKVGEWMWGFQHATGESMRSVPVDICRSNARLGGMKSKRGGIL